MKIRERVQVVIFGTETLAGRVFDLALLVTILASVAMVMLESVRPFSVRFSWQFGALEWFFTILFTLEYLLRLWSAPSRRQYAGSFFGIIDLLAVLPTYIPLFTQGGNVFLMIRILRLLRIFRILKLTAFSDDAHSILVALRQSRRRTAVFLYTVLLLVTLLGSAMYVIESRQDGFASIPESIYWAIVTITTVGYGDLYPQTPLGQAVSAVVMLLGYAMIAVPTGIFAVELHAVREREGKGLLACTACRIAGHAEDARYCRSCGALLPKKGFLIDEGGQGVC